MSENCKKPIYGPLGSFVGYCQLLKGHKWPCMVYGLSEQDMVDICCSKDLEGSAK